jgi:hypothetical protein
VGMPLLWRVPHNRYIGIYKRFFLPQCRHLHLHRYNGARKQNTPGMKGDHANQDWCTHKYSASRLSLAPSLQSQSPLSLKVHYRSTKTSQHHTSATVALGNSLHAAQKQPLGPSCNRLYPRPEAEPLSRTLRLRRSRRRCNECEG